MGLTAYTVLSEFRFDVGHAVLASEQLQGKVDALSQSVNNAMENAKAMGVNFVYSMGGGSAGVLGLLNAAVSASDKFTQSQLSFTQIIDSNMQHLTGTIGTLNERMAVSKAIMNDIGKDARKFGIPAAELLEMTKSLSAMLVPKGLAGENFKGARDLSRNLLKSAPNLGIHPAEVQGQLLRSVEGSASMGDTLFRRLLTEAPEPFKQAKVKDAKGFNVLDAAKRFNILNEAMAKFANNSDLLTMRANTLAGVMQRAKDLFFGFTSVLKPLGDVILPPLIEVLNMAIQWIDVHGRKIVESMAAFLKPLIENPKKFLIDLKQVSALSEDLKLATNLTGAVITLIHLQEILHVISKIPVIGPFVGMFADFLKNIKWGGGLMKMINFGFANMGKIFSFMWPVLRMVFMGILEFGAGLAAFLIPLQGLSRAVARMEIDTVEWLALNMASLSETFLSLKHSVMVFYTPIQDMITGFEELFYAIIGGTYFLDLMKNELQHMAEQMKTWASLFGELYAGFRGLIAGMFDVFFRTATNVGIIMSNLKNGNIMSPMEGTSNIFAGYMQAGAEEFTKTLDKFSAPTVDGGVDNAKVSSQVNNYDVKMQNNFKEVLQPDRIAFTIKDQLEKASTHKTQSRASSIGGLNAKAI